MLLWIDHKIFGNGFGMATPFFDGRFYWLVNTKDSERKGARGELYTFSSGFGAQLRSIQWTHPKAGERRRLCNREFVVFHSARRWGRVEVAWSLVGLPKDIDAKNAALRELEHELGRSWA